MKLDNRYELRMCVVEIFGDDGEEGNSYESYAAYLDHGTSGTYDIRYMVIDTETGFIPDDLEPYYNTPVDAILAHEELIFASRKRYIVTINNGTPESCTLDETVSEISNYLNRYTDTDFYESLKNILTCMTVGDSNIFAGKNPYTVTRTA